MSRVRVMLFKSAIIQSTVPRVTCTLDVGPALNIGALEVMDGGMVEETCTASKQIQEREVNLYRE